MDAALKKVALEQAAIILQGTARAILYMLSICMCTTVQHYMYTKGNSYTTPHPINILLSCTTDHSFHEQLLEEGFSDDLTNLLSPLFDSPSTEGDPLTSLATPCIQCISLLANSSRSLRLELVSNCKFLLGLYKG